MKTRINLKAIIHIFRSLSQQDLSLARSLMLIPAAPPYPHPPSLLLHPDPPYVFLL